MADIFVSYSKQDEALARRMVATLEAAGYSVWWDQSLLGGEQYRKVIMTELAHARATIVIWTENSIHSDWVQSEAGRAHAERKLIPVKTRALSYRDIPPPFDNMHTEHVDDREKILAAVVTQLARPQAPPTRMGLAVRKARLELLSWFGIAGAAITLTTNLKSVLTLAEWIRQLLGTWTDIAHALWARLLFFAPKVPMIDAILLTFVAFLSVNIATSFRRDVEARRPAWRYASAFVASLLVQLLCVHGLFASSSQGTESYSDLIVGYYLGGDAMARWLGSVVGSSGVLWISAVVVGFAYIYVVMILPVVPIFLLVALVARRMGFRFSLQAFASRLWRILIGVALIVAFNYASLWLAAQPWLAPLLR